MQVVTGQRIYVPAYALIPTSDGTTTRTLTATLAIHNVNDGQPIVITSIEYHDEQRKSVTEFIEQGWVLPPLATVTAIVRQDDLSGVVGASFTVEWVAESELTPPIAETMMVITTGNQGLSFVSRGVVVEEF